MTKKIYVETFKKCPVSLCFTLLMSRFIDAELESDSDPDSDSEAESEYDTVN